MLRTWVGRVVAVADGRLRAHQVAGDLARMDADAVVGLLADAQDGVGDGDGNVLRFMTALQDALALGLVGYDRQTELYAAAARAGLVSVQRLFLAPPPRQLARARGPGKPPDGQDTLGMRTWRARTTRGQQQLDRLARDTDPRVIHNLLLNPHLTEKLVVCIATRRPVSVEVLREVASNERWNVRPSVRRALAFNPYTPTETSLRMLPHLTRQDLHALAVDARVHAEVAQQAAVYARRKPPVKNPPAARGRSQTRVEGAAANEDLEQDRPSPRRGG
jgi:hypothetical protein